MDYQEQQQTRLFDKSSYLPRTISVYQIVGAYLVDIYYNHLFAEAHKYRGKGEVPTVTEGYRHATFAFLSGLDHNAKATYKAQHYKQLLIGINEYFKAWTSFNTLTVSDCIDKIVREFVPDDYFKQLDKEQKGSILRMVLTSTMREFTKIVVGEYLSAVVDNHEEPANIEALKDRIVDVMISEREKMFHKFLASHFPASNETVDKKFAERMRDEITKLQTEVGQYKALAIKQQEEIETRKLQLQQVVTKFRKMESAYKRIVEECKLSKDTVLELESQVQEYERNRPRMDELESSEFMTSNDEPSISAMDSLIDSHTVKNVNGGSISNIPAPVTATNKVEVKTSIGTLAPALPTALPTASTQDTVKENNTKPTTKPALVKPPAKTNARTTATKAAAKVAPKAPVRTNNPKVETKAKESESEESEESESEEDEDNKSAKLERKISLPVVKNTPAVSMSSLVDQPKVTIGAASSLSDAY